MVRIVLGEEGMEGGSSSKVSLYDTLGQWLVMVVHPWIYVLKIERYEFEQTKPLNLRRVDI